MAQPELHHCLPFEGADYKKQKEIYIYIYVFLVTPISTSGDFLRSIMKQNLTLQQQMQEWQVGLGVAGKGLENRDKQFSFDAIKGEDVEGKMLEVAG